MTEREIFDLNTKCKAVSTPCPDCAEKDKRIDELERLFDKTDDLLVDSKAKLEARDGEVLSEATKKWITDLQAKLQKAEKVVDAARPFRCHLSLSEGYSMDEKEVIAKERRALNAAIATHDKEKK